MTTLTADAQLAEYGILTDPGGRDLQALVDLAAMICDVPTAAINLISSDSQHQVATAGFDPSICARSDSMCAAVLDEPGTVIAEDASVDPRFAQNPFVTGTIGNVKFYASAPLTTPEGITIGRLCVFDENPRRLTEEQAHVLQELATRMVDVLELRLRTRQLEETQDELHRSNELLTLFAGQVSHDLRSPLTAVLANTELLAGEPAVVADAELGQLVNATLDAGRRMSGLIDTVLDYARPGAALKPADVDLGRVLADVLHDLEPAIRARGGTIEVGDLPVVRGDVRLLHTVLQNLISNAVKFTPVGTAPQVTVAAVRHTDHWRLSVADNGRGVPEERRQSVFDLYTRGEGSIEGSGIGLATARRLVEAHGGTIGIDDAAAGGAEVWFTLPG